MTQHESQFQARIASLSAERRVRALAGVGSYGTPQQWAGSLPTLLCFERGLAAAHSERSAGAVLHRFPVELLEEAPKHERPWQVLGDSLNLLAMCRPVYDPGQLLARVQRRLAQLAPAELAAYRAERLAEAERRLELARRSLSVGSGVAAQLLTLIEARRVASTLLYPALLSYLHHWPASESDLRLPHHWRAQAGLAFPKAVYHLDALYGFGGESEARRVLLATRGLNLTEPEKRARIALQAGYYDGAVRFVRDEAARRWLSELERWTSLSGARQEKLGVLLGAGLSPLGPVALQVASELLEDVRLGH